MRVQTSTTHAKPQQTRQRRRTPSLRPSVGKRGMQKALLRKDLTRLSCGDDDAWAQQNLLREETLGR